MRDIEERESECRKQVNAYELYCDKKELMIKLDKTNMTFLAAQQAHQKEV
jgi:hypothetical protein